MYRKLHVLLNSLGSLSGILGDGDGDLHVVFSSELGAPCNKLFAHGLVIADGLVQVVD